MNDESFICSGGEVLALSASMTHADSSWFHRASCMLTLVALAGTLAFWADRLGLLRPCFWQLRLVAAAISMGKSILHVSVVGKSVKSDIKNIKRGHSCEWPPSLSVLDGLELLHGSHYVRSVAISPSNRKITTFYELTITSATRDFGMKCAEAVRFLPLFTIRYF